MAIKRALNDAHLREGRRYLDRFIRTKTIDHDNVAGPGQSFQRTANVGRFVESENQWRNLIEHRSGDLARVADHIFPKPRRAPVKGETEIRERVTGQQS